MLLGLVGEERLPQPAREATETGALRRPARARLIRSRRLGQQLREAPPASEDQQVSRLEVLTPGLPRRLPSLLAAGDDRLFVSQSVDEGFRGLRKDRQRLAHPAVVEVDEHPELCKGQLPAFVRACSERWERRPRDERARPGGALP